MALFCDADSDGVALKAFNLAKAGVTDAGPFRGCLMMHVTRVVIRHETDMSHEPVMRDVFNKKIVLFIVFNESSVQEFQGDDCLQAYFRASDFY